MATKSEFQKELEGRLRELQGKIENFEEKAKETQGETRKEIESTIDNLQRQSEEAERRLEELQKAGDDVWQTMVKDMETTWNDLSTAVDNVFFSSGNATTTKTETTPDIETPSATDVHDGSDD